MLAWHSIPRNLIFAVLVSHTLYVTPAFSDPQNKETLPLDELKRFTTVVDHIRHYYVEPVDDTQLFENAIRGMLAGLDPHSAYFDEEEYAELKESTSGKFVGLGIKVTLEDGLIRVISPIDDTPAQKAGIKPGDLIIRLENTPVKGLTLKKAVDMMRGAQGSSILLTVIREGQDQPLMITVKRETINTKSVKSRILENTYGYVRIAQFQNDTGKAVQQAIDDLTASSKNSLKGIVLDLRNNPGGLLTSCVEVADTFLDRNALSKNKLIVSAKGRLSGSDLEEHAHTGDKLNGAPIVVLVNEGSASASEIVAGALQDHRRAVVVGMQTFGKGSVQTILPLKDKRGLKLTTALYYTPSGRSIQATGITPDITIPARRLPADPNAKKALFTLREQDLEHHLRSQPGSAAPTADTETENDRPLIESDFQLFEALNILKGLSYFKTAEKKN